jgi:undecaprenyl diphosphate synthase
MRALRRFLRERRDEMIEEGIQLDAIGRLGELPRRVRKELDKTRELTRPGKNLRLTLALNYGARAEIVDAARTLADRAQKGELAPAQINESELTSNLYTAGLPDPDLLIRSGGEKRLSNFLLWQNSYAELYFTDVLWPEFNEDTFREALEEFALRERRFGGLREEQRPTESNS